MSAQTPVVDPFLGGFFTVGDATRLLRMDNRQRIYRWLAPAKDGAGEPVILRDYEPLGQHQELSFWDIIEVRFVEHFRAQGLSLQFLRKVAVAARKRMKTRHPFALSTATYLTDRKRIFEQTARGEDKATMDLLSGQYQMYETIEEVLSKGIAFDPKTALAQEWRPFHNDCPNVIVSPRFAYGQPVIGDRRVPTRALYRQWRAEGDKNRVARWYGVDAGEVSEAIEFEVRLAA